MISELRTQISMTNMVKEFYKIFPPCCVLVIEFWDLRYVRST